MYSLLRSSRRINQCRFIFNQRYVNNTPVPELDDEEKRILNVLKAFKPRNKLQEVARELNMIMTDKALQLQTQSIKDQSKSITEESRFLREHINSPFVRFNLLTRKLIREFIAHPEYSIIGRVKVLSDKDNKQKIDFNIQRYSFENTDELGLMLFVFSDEDSMDNFQAQIQGKVMESSDLTSDKLISILNRLATEKEPQHFADGNNSLTGGIVVDPSLPCYFVLNREKFTELPKILFQLSMETILRKLQHEQMNPKWPSEISNETIDGVFQQILDYEEYNVFLLEGENNEENLLTITHVHPDFNEKGVYQSEPNHFIYIPVFTDPDLATDYLSLLERHYEDTIKHKCLSVVTMKGSDILEWLHSTKEVYGILFNPTESIFEGTKKLPEYQYTQKSIKENEISPDMKLLASPYYSLPDFPSLPYLCSLKRRILFKE